MAGELPESQRIAEQFQLEWDSGGVPNLADWLSKFPVVMREELAKNLLPVDLENRLKRGMSACPDDYEQLGSGIRPIVEGWLQRVGEEVQATLDVTHQKSTWKLLVGSTIGPYRLLQMLGEGGMGEVWMAEQSKPVKRRVALKLIKKGLALREVLVRFEAERQALAMMNHPNIARILDTGTAVDGRPWFSMELVQGQPLTVYCDQNRLSIDERLKLFTDICNGLQHAHQKGIIHRDLKPTNILVSIQDGQAVPKIIDFGLAKAMESTQRLTDQSLFTGIGQILGTLKYMSPEQASLDNLDIDTRTDIYALGVVLYELLTGSTPLDDASLKSQAVMKVLDMIRELDPVKPSSKLSCSSQTAQFAITGRRKTNSVSLRRVLEGDLDWIVMKALEKDRTRRYESASGFAADIRRYLNNEPVVARPPSVSYRVRKFVGKNRLGVIAASLVLLALLGGTVGSTMGMLRAESARKEAVLAKKAETAQREEAEKQFQRALAAESLAYARQQEAEHERSVAEKRRIEAEQNLTYAKTGNEILGSVFSGLDPKAEFTSVSELRKSLSENLEKAAKALDESAIGDPLSVADMQETLGLSLLGLGEYSSAIQRFERAKNLKQEKLGADHPSTLSSINNLACGLEAFGHLDKALPLFEETLKLRKEKLGPDHPATLSTMNNLAMSYESNGQLDKALPLLVETLELTRAKLGLDHLDTLNSMNNLAISTKAAGQLDKALSLLEETLTLCKAHLRLDHPLTLTVANNLAQTCQAAGQLKRALQLWEESVAQSKDKLGIDHPTTLAIMNNLAGGYESVGQAERAFELYEETLKLKKAKLGPDHPSTLTTMNDLAGCYEEVGQPDKALVLFEETLKLKAAKLGREHPSTLISMNDLAASYYNANQIDKAIPLWEEVLAQRKANYEPDHPEILTTMNNLAAGYKVAGQLDKAMPLYSEAVTLMENKLGRSHSLTLSAMSNMARGYEAVGQLSKAVPLLEETLELRKLQLGTDHPDTMNSMLNLGAAYGVAERGELASATLREFIEAKRRNSLIGEPHFEIWLVTASMILLKCEQFSAAEEMLSETLQIRELKEPDSWTTFNTMSLLGAALLGQQKYSQAELLLIKGYDGMKARIESIPPEGATRIPEAIDRLLELYKSLEKSDEVVKWEAEKEKMRKPPAE